MDYNKCTTSINDRLIVVKEHRREFRIDNNKNRIIKKVVVDGCLMKDFHEKCDFIFSIESINKALFIELKGCDIEKGISQLTSTLNKTKSKYENYIRECYIVSSRVPKHYTRIRKLKTRLFNDTKSTLTIKNNKQTILLED